MTDGQRAQASGDQSIASPDVELVEVGPRDGLQNEATVVPTAIKLEYIRRATRAGIRRVEVTSFVHPDRVPQMADAEELALALVPEAGVVHSALVLNRRGFERANRCGIREVNAVVVASDTFCQRNQGQTTSEAIAFVDDLSRRAASEAVRVSVTISAAFGCPFEGEVPVARVAATAERLAGSGPAEIVIADTIGVGVPTQVIDVIGAVAAAAPGIPLRCHFHNTRNTGYANAVAALSAGVHSFDGSTGGIGGCPFAPRATGNVATEDLTYLFERMGHATGVILEQVCATGSWIAEQLGITPPALLGRAGGFPTAKI
ncbi:MAG: hydroxymethylglutaryl-CoA lyase [Acidimicrobiales bacterium]